MEKEPRMILCQAIQSGAWASTPASPGLGSRMAALFAGAGLDTPIEAWQGQEAEVFLSSDGPYRFWLEQGLDIVLRELVQGRIASLDSLV